MSRSKRRRRTKQARYLKQRASEHSRKLCCEWNKRVVSWLTEIQRRAARLRAGAQFSDVERLFEVVANAEALLSNCDQHVQTLVGEYTRSTLRAECCKAVASLYGADLYRVVAHKPYGRWREWDRHLKQMDARRCKSTN